MLLLDYALLVSGTFVLVSLFLTCLLYSGVCGAYKYSCKPPLVEPLGSFSTLFC